MRVSVQIQLLKMLTKKKKMLCTHYIIIYTTEKNEINIAFSVRRSNENR